MVPSAASTYLWLLLRTSALTRLNPWLLSNLPLSLVLTLKSLVAVRLNTQVKVQPSCQTANDYSA